MCGPTSSDTSAPTLVRFVSSSLESGLRLYGPCYVAPMVVATYISELQEIVTEIEAAVHPPLSSPVSVPSFPDNKGSVRSRHEVDISDECR